MSHASSRAGSCSQDEIEQIHKEVLEFECIEAISEPMRDLIEELWPELTHKLPPKEGEE
jgi:hypothetical protein